MTEAGAKTLRKILGFSAFIELITGLTLLAAPSLVISLLLGNDFSVAGVLLGRFFGIGLVALGLACWPDHQRSASASAAFRGLLFYNAVSTLYFVYIGVVLHMGGLLLWPAAAFHTTVSLLLVFYGRHR